MEQESSTFQYRTHSVFMKSVKSDHRQLGLHHKILSFSVELFGASTYTEAAGPLSTVH